MAPSTITIVTIMPWPHFQAFKDNLPIIGGKLYTYQPETSTPKAAFQDPAFITAHENPILLNDQGATLIYLDGFYHLRLFDEDDVLLWEVPLFSFDTGAPPMPGTIIEGTTEATVTPAPGTGVITVPNLAPAGYRVIGVTSTVTTTFGTSGGMSTISIGDGVLLDRWGGGFAPDVGAQTGQLQFHGGDQPIATTAYSVLITAQGGLFDATGTIHLTCYWESLAVDTP